MALNDSTQGAIEISYNKQSDNLSYKLQGASLKKAMKKIALQTGLEVLFDPRAEATLNISSKSLPLERALTNLLKGKNYSFQYSGEEPGIVLTSITILPSDALNSNNAKTLLNIEQQAQYRAMSQLSHQTISELNSSEERWQKRLERLPAKYREDMQVRINRKLLTKAKKQQKRKERAEKRQAKRDKRKADNNKRQQQYLSSLTSEQIEANKQARDQKKSELLQQIKHQLQNRN